MRYVAVVLILVAGGGSLLMLKVINSSSNILLSISAFSLSIFISPMIIITLCELGKKIVHLRQ